MNVYSFGNLPWQFAVCSMHSKVTTTDFIPIGSKPEQTRIYHQGLQVKMNSKSGFQNNLSHDSNNNNNNEEEGGGGIAISLFYNRPFL